jgi:hypothetical protein
MWCWSPASTLLARVPSRSLKLAPSAVKQRGPVAVSGSEIQWTCSVLVHPAGPA